jgi:hypothetical protein
VPRKSSTKKYIHVNQHKIRANLKMQLDNNQESLLAMKWVVEPVITIKEGRKNTYCHEVEILGPSKVVYGENGEKILGCGARVVVETESEYRVIR